MQASHTLLNYLIKFKFFFHFLDKNEDLAQPFYQENEKKIENIMTDEEILKSANQNAQVLDVSDINLYDELRDDNQDGYDPSNP